MVATRTGPAKSRLPKFDLEEAKAVFVLGRRPDCPENWEVHDGGIGSEGFTKGGCAF